jgi:hypothetical protein
MDEGLHRRFCVVHCISMRDASEIEATAFDGPIVATNDREATLPR